MSEFDILVRVMRKVRKGCPWDREQTHASLKPNMLGELAEYFDAVDDGDDAHMKEEIGDLLMQLILNCVIAEERGAFSLEDAAREEARKMISRHPHVFADAEGVATPDQVETLWAEIKKKEKAHRKSVLDGLPRNLPALTRAEKMQKKAAKVGFDWTEEAPIREKIREELKEMEEADREGGDGRFAEEAGDLMFSIVNLLRHRGLDPDAVLNRANDKFERRFREVERLAAEQGGPMQERSLAELDALWERVKREE